MRLDRHLNTTLLGLGSGMTFNPPDDAGSGGGGIVVSSDHYVGPRAVRPTFLERPKRSELNETWGRMSASLGVAYDVRKAGRAIDTNLLYELARHGRDGPDDARVAAELAGASAIDGRAFEQITNNTNYGGGDRPLGERLAFALAVELHGGSELLHLYFQDRRSRDGVDPLTKLHDLIQPNEPLASWKASMVEVAAALKTDAANGQLLESPAFAASLRLRLEARGDLAAGEYPSLSAAGLAAYETAVDSGQAKAMAATIAERATRGQLDVPTLQMLAPPASDHPRIYVRAEYGNSASVPAPSFEEAQSYASDVARGRLDYGQLHSFLRRYGNSDDWLVPRLSLTEAVEMIKATNRGDMSAEGLDEALDPKLYLPPKLANKIWQRMFSGRTRTGNKYTVSGGAPESVYTAALTTRLTAPLVQKLANDPNLRRSFATKFGARLDDLLPSRFGMWRLRRTNDDSRWERKLYDGYVSQALDDTKRSLGIA